MRKLLALLLALLVVCSIAACDDQKSDEKKKAPEDGLCGQWEGAVNLAAYFNRELENASGQMLEYWKAEELRVVVRYEFTDDGEYTMTIDEDAFEEAVLELVPGLADAAREALEDQGKDVDAIEAELDMSIEAYFEEGIKEMIPDMFMKTEGAYELKGSKLYLDEDGEYIKIKVTEKTLKFISYSGEDDLAEMYGDVTFKRQ